ncbi:hypothetical protein PR202_ga11502 [Eleusine coracana subsp. coracana]|uniref:Derlin n=1 Tax=Eleusine coracana subsp. coracana TaxID=191504 RepID=A0AAV5C9E6_ELECO|nr:hypothetical protein PR202_ga11502 [Eleusine coracana subsp. coracana]
MRGLSSRRRLAASLPRPPARRLSSRRLPPSSGDEVCSLDDRQKLERRRCRLSPTLLRRRDLPGLGSCDAGGWRAASLLSCFFEMYANSFAYFRWYNSLPPISKAFGTLCVLTATLVQLQILSPSFFALYYPSVFKHFQIWRLFTTFFFLGEFSINFGIRLLMIARYGVQLEKGAFERRTADFLWMMIFGAISLLVSDIVCYSTTGVLLLGNTYGQHASLCLEQRVSECTDNIYGIIPLRSFYLPWVMLALDVIFGSPILPGLMGIMVGHLYYFLAVLHPLATGKNFLKTPKWVYPFTLLLRPKPSFSKFAYTYIKLCGLATLITNIYCSVSLTCCTCTDTGLLLDSN